MTFLLETMKLGLTNLRLHLLRSILTALGIILGVTAVITMVSIGEGSKRQALDQLERLGAKNIIIRSLKPSAEIQSQSVFVQSYGLKRKDLAVIESYFADQAEAIVPLKAVGSQVIRGSRVFESQSFGVQPEMLAVTGLRVEQGRGRYLTDGDLRDRAMVAVLGYDLARQLFPDADPLGNTFRIDTKVFRVVGVLAPVGLAGGAGASLVGRDFNLDVHIPFTTARSAFSDTVMRNEGGATTFEEVEVQEIYVAAEDRGTVLTDAARLRRIVESAHPEMEDVQMIVPFELLEEAKKQQLTWNLVLGSVAGISLLVGGIGIMNIMLATVTERTREIGIRRALGATRKHILAQFIVETGVLSMIGGIVGVGLGIVLSLAVSSVVPMLPDLPVIGTVFQKDIELPTQVTGWSIAVSFLVATATGLIFGIYPATVAAKQDPIVALRHD